MEWEEIFANPLSEKELYKKCIGHNSITATKAETHNSEMGKRFEQINGQQLYEKVFKF